MKGGLKPHSSGIKPFLTEQNKYIQLMYAMEMVNPNDTTKFQDMYNFIHADEKWFYLVRDRQQFILADEELPSQHCVCHKGCITKEMFLCVVAHACYKNTTILWRYGKLGICQLDLGKQLNSDLGAVNAVQWFGKTKV